MPREIMFKAFIELTLSTLTVLDTYQDDRGYEIEYCSSLIDDTSRAREEKATLIIKKW